MESKAKFLGHAIHPILIVFPLGLLAAGVVFDTVYLITDYRTAATVAYWIIISGILGGIAAAPFGWIDWFAIPSGTRAKSVGLRHGAGNVLVLLLFTASWWLRYERSEMHMLIYILSYAGAAIAAIAGWLGGELVDRLGVGIDNGAHLNAPNSLSNRPASENSQR